MFFQLLNCSTEPSFSCFFRPEKFGDDLHKWWEDCGIIKSFVARPPPTCFFSVKIVGSNEDRQELQTPSQNILLGRRNLGLLTVEISQTKPTLEFLSFVPEKIAVFTNSLPTVLLTDQ